MISTKSILVHGPGRSNQALPGRNVRTDGCIVPTDRTQIDFRARQTAGFCPALLGLRLAAISGTKRELLKESELGTYFRRYFYPVRLWHDVLGAFQLRTARG